jgi:hypothetical protein
VLSVNECSFVKSRIQSIVSSFLNVEEKQIQNQEIHKFENQTISIQVQQVFNGQTVLGQIQISTL